MICYVEWKWSGMSVRNETYFILVYSWLVIILWTFFIAIYSLGACSLAFNLLYGCQNETLSLIDSHFISHLLVFLFLSMCSYYVCIRYFVALSAILVVYNLVMTYWILSLLHLVIPLYSSYKLLHVFLCDCQSFCRTGAKILPVSH